MPKRTRKPPNSPNHDHIAVRRMPLNLADIADRLHAYAKEVHRLQTRLAELERENAELRQAKTD